MNQEKGEITILKALLKGFFLQNIVNKTFKYILFQSGDPGPLVLRHIHFLQHTLEGNISSLLQMSK